MYELTRNVDATCTVGYCPAVPSSRPGQRSRVWDWWRVGVCCQFFTADHA